MDLILSSFRLKLDFLRGKNMLWYCFIWYSLLFEVPFSYLIFSLFYDVDTLWHRADVVGSWKIPLRRSDVEQVGTKL